MHPCAPPTRHPGRQARKSSRAVPGDWTPVLGAGRGKWTPTLALGPQLGSAGGVKIGGFPPSPAQSGLGLARAPRPAGPSVRHWGWLGQGPPHPHPGPPAWVCFEEGTLMWGSPPSELQSEPSPVGGLLEPHQPHQSGAQDGQREQTPVSAPGPLSGSSMGALGQRVPHYSPAQPSCSG